MDNRAEATRLVDADDDLARAEKAVIDAIMKSHKANENESATFILAGAEIEQAVELLFKREKEYQIARKAYRATIPLLTRE